MYQVCYAIYLKQFKVLKYHNQDCRFNGICLGDNLYTKKKFIKEQAKGLKTYVCNVPMLAYTF